MNKADKELRGLTESISYEDLFLRCDDIKQYYDDTQQPLDNDSPIDSQDFMNSFDSTSNNVKYKRIKSSVMNEINNSMIKRKWKKNVLAASLVLCILLSAVSPFGRKTLANLVDKLYFVPGSGKAIEDNAEDVYILPKPINFDCFGGTITIHTITKRSDSIMIYATGNIPKDPINLSLEIKDKEYKSFSSSRGVGSNNVAIYYFSIPDDVDNFTLNFYNEYSIPITLTKAESFDDYTELGPTSIKNEFGLTLVPNRLNNKIYFDIVQHHTNRGEVSLYGSDDKLGSNNINILIHDNKGHSYTAGYPETHMGIQSSFSFTPENNTNYYTVEIPQITLKYNLDNKITLPMPEQGETVINKTVDLQGYKIVITKIIRKNNLITAYVNTNYNEKSPQNICYFLLDMDKMSLDYYHWILNDQVTTEAFEFYVNPKKRKLTLYFKELYTILKGPWTFNITDKDF